MGYVENDYISNNHIEHEYYYAGNFGAKGEKRAKKEKPTPLQIKKNNHWNLVKRTKRLLQYNFFPTDKLLTLKYRAGTRKDIDSLKKDVSRFLRVMKTQYRKRGKEFMFIYRLEIGKLGGLHVHLVCNRIPDFDLIAREAWKRASEDTGAIDSEDLEAYGGFKGLAEYICKDPDEEIQGQLSFLLPQEQKKLYSVSSSRNLKRPEPIRKERKHWTMRKILTEGPKPTPGYVIDQDSIRQGINPFTGYSYFSYTEVREHPITREEYENGSKDKLIYPHKH